MRGGGGGGVGGGADTHTSAGEPSLSSLVEAARDNDVQAARDVINAHRRSSSASADEQHTKIDQDELATALWAACSNGHVDMASLLLENSAPVEFSDSDGFTALFWAVESGHPDLVNLLLEHGADANARTDAGEATPLIMACEGTHGAKDVAIVKALLARNVDTEAADAQDATARDFAEACEDEETGEELVALLDAYENEKGRKRAQPDKGAEARNGDDVKTENERPSKRSKAPVGKAKVSLTSLFGKKR